MLTTSQLVLLDMNDEDTIEESETSRLSPAPAPAKLVTQINGDTEPTSLSFQVCSGPSSWNSHESSLRSDVTKVELPDYDDAENSLNLTTVTLKKCKKQVLRPYWRLLQFVGWRGFGKESTNPSHLKWRLVNALQMLVVLALMLFCHVYEGLTCSWRLNLVTDIKPPTVRPVHHATARPRIPPTPSDADVFNLGNDSLRNHYYFRDMDWPPTIDSHDYLNDSMPEFLLTPADDVSLACHHVITTYVVPNILHFLAYVMGFCYFRIQENEQLYALMEKVFLQATPLQGRMVSQSNMIRRMRVFLACGGLWVILPLVLHLLYAFNYVTDRITEGPLSGWTLFGLFMLGTLITSGVSLAVVLNYAAQCELLTFFVSGIQMRLQERSVHLKFAMKDILAVRQSLSQLNGSLSRMTSILVITFAEMIIIGVSILVKNQNDYDLMWAYRGMFPIVWFIPFVFPLVQAARCNSACHVLKRMALETRVFGYQGSTTAELDSFLLWVSNARMRATLFHMPVRASYLIFIAVMIIITFIVLIQNDVIAIGEGLL